MQSGASGAGRLPWATPCGSRPGIPRLSLVGATHEDVLHFHEFLEALPGPFAPKTRLLHAAEGGHLGRDDAGVHTHHAGLHLLGDAPDAADIAAVEVSGEPELGGVREADRLFF